MSGSLERLFLGSGQSVLSLRRVLSSYGETRKYALVIVAGGDGEARGEPIVSDRLGEAKRFLRPKTAMELERSLRLRRMPRRGAVLGRVRRAFGR